MKTKLQSKAKQYMSFTGAEPNSGFKSDPGLKSCHFPRHFELGC